MADGKDLNSKEVKQFGKGLHTDNSPQTQPEGTLRFALNCVDETEIGDTMFPTNMESNEMAGELPEGYTPIGKVYMVDGKTALFLVGPNGESEIGVYEDTGVYTTKVNDTDSVSKLNFKITNQIDAIYRLRRGCDHTIYWTDNINPVRQYILNKPEDYLEEGLFNADKFNLFKRWNKIPKFENFNIKDTGQLKAGSYNIAIQYLDEDLNPTEWLIASDTINIYHDALNKPFRQIRGSSNATNSYQDWGESTGKSIEVIVSNLDTNFHFYRLGLIEATNGTGLVSKVTASDPLPIGTTKHIFENNNGTVITVEEISQASEYIETAQSIEQIENRLLLGNTKGKQIDFCSLQQYASRIVSNYTVKEVVLDSLEDLNESIGNASSKDPLVNIKDVGYMPGEIYSFGIVYYFKDGSTSPVYHIPGKASNDNTNISNMSNNNRLDSNYTSSINCEDKKYWGKDYMGNDLNNTPIRHHRFPTREEAKIGFVSQKKVNTSVEDTYRHYFTIKLSNTQEPLYYDVTFTFTWSDGTITEVNLQMESGVENEVIYEENFLADKNLNENPVITSTVCISYPDFSDQNYTITYSPPEPTQNIITKKYNVANIFGIKFSDVTVPKEAPFTGPNEIIGYKIVRNERTENNKTILDSGVMFPITKYQHFLAYGHSIPNMANNPNFSIVDNAVAFINPEFLFNKREYNQTDIKFVQVGDFVTLPLVETTSTGTYKRIPDRVIENFVQDAYPGTTYNAKIHAASEKDKDGLTLHTVTRFRDAVYKGRDNKYDLASNGIKDLYYLSALASKASVDDDVEMFNISSDNNIGILTLSQDAPKQFTIESSKIIPVSKYRGLSLVDTALGKYAFADEIFDVEATGTFIFKTTPVSEKSFYNLDMQTTSNIPYFYMVRDLNSAYSNFRYLPYYSEHNNIIPITQEITDDIYNGDAYISPMTYNNTFFHDIKPKKRETKSSVWNFVLGGLAIVAGVVGAVITGGGSLTLTALGVGLVGAAAGITLFAGGVEMNKISSIYQDKYEEGLKYVSVDGTTRSLFLSDSPTFLDKSAWDDEIQWYNEVINGLWFESQVNIGLRQGNTLGLPDFIDSPYEFSGIQDSRGSLLHYRIASASNPYFRRRAINKLSVLDPDAGGGRLYQGFCTSEFYEVNKDFQRRERQKPFFHLGLEYDCCADCIETFPHRVHYSEQSFQEELTDNYRIFLPNNYTDINGETGDIVNIFKIQNNLFIHTKEAIWKLPKNYQERVTDEIVSFIGTGSYFSIPPQKLVDDETGNSYGTKHKWSRLKTIYGYFFVCEDQNTICMFDGNQVKDISSLGNYYWFYNNLPLMSNTINRDNPSNPEGAGFIATYDSKKDLVFFTKIDKLPTGENNSWTASFSIKKNCWNSWHSFMPSFYIQTTQWYFSWKPGNKYIWRHNVLGNYQTYYGTLYPHIIEYVLTDNLLSNKIFNDIMIQLESKKYDPLSKTFFDTDKDFFNKLIAYNSRQCTGELNIVVKDKEAMDFFSNQISNSDLSSIIADRVERNWNINELRDMVVTKNTPMFINDITKLQDKYYIDKRLNPNVVDFNKDWTQIESFRDKYLVVRLIFDKFADVKLITNFTINNEDVSTR